MTKNQIDYQALQENIRSHQASEGLTHEANVETARSNRAREQLNFDTLQETKRSNLAREAETNRSNLAKELQARRELSETTTHNRVTESEANRSNLAKEIENNRSNVAREAENYRSNTARESETALHDRNTETLTAQGQVRSANASKYSADRSYAGSVARSDASVEAANINAAAAAAVEQLRQEGYNTRQVNELIFNSAKIINDDLMTFYRTNHDEDKLVDRIVNSVEQQLGRRRK